MHDFSALNCDNRDESLVIGGTIRKNPPVHLVLEDHDATIPRPVHNKCVAGVKLDRLDVSGEARRALRGSGWPNLHLPLRIQRSRRWKQWRLTFLPPQEFLTAKLTP